MEKDVHTFRNQNLRIQLRNKDEYKLINKENETTDQTED